MKVSEFLAHFPDYESEHDGWVVPCPAHDDTHYSLKVSVTEDDKMLVVCRAGCPQKDIIKALPVSTTDLFRVENDTDLSTVSAGSVPEVSGGQVAQLKMYLDGAASAWLTADEDAHASVVNYCAERFGLTEDDIADLGLGLDVGSIPFTYLSTTWRNVPRLVVPFRDFGGTARGAQGRSLNPFDDGGAKWCSLSSPDGAVWSKLAVFDRQSGLDTWIITEGPGDALTAYAAGYNAVAVRGAALNSNRRLLEQLAEGLQGKRVLVCGDDDPAGERFARALSVSLSERGYDVSVLAVPFDANDLSEAFQSDPEGFAAALDSADRSAVPPDNAAPVQTVTDPSMPDGYAMTDLGNAHRLVDSFAGNLRYTEAHGFHVYSGGVWTPDTHDSVVTASQTIVTDLVTNGKDAEETGRARGDASLEEAGKKMIGWGRASQSVRAIKAMVELASTVRGVRLDVEDFDSHRHLLAFNNGVVDLRDGSLHPHDRELYLTRMVGVAYDPAATCPRWEQFLTEVFPSEPDMPAFVRRLVGYGITGETDEQAFAVLWGTGANGKSVFTETLGHVFDSVTSTTPFSTFEQKHGGGGIPNDLAALNGARLVLASEGEQGKPMAEAVIKRMTGQDKIAARFMRREFFEFTPTFLILLATNFKPNFRGQDEGLWRRVKLIPFRRFFAPNERDHKLTFKLRDEAEGIAAWAVRGAVEWYRSGLGEPEVVIKATESYRSNSDALDGFIPGVFEHGSPDDRIDAQVIYARYVDWCDEMELATKERWSRKAVYAALEERGFERIRSHGKRYIVGIRWASGNSEPERPDPPDLAYTGSTNNHTPLATRLQNLGGSE